MSRAEKIFDMPVADVYLHYVNKISRKGQNAADLDVVIGWLTGFDKKAIQRHLGAKTTFRDFFAQSTLHPNAGLITGSICGVKIEEIQRVVCAHMGIPEDLIRAKTRRQEIVNARQVAMYVFRELTDLSYPAIARLFGGRDHTTVMHADRKIRELMAERRSIYNQVTELTNRIKTTAKG